MSINGAPTGGSDIDIVYYTILFFYSRHMIIIHFGDYVLSNAVCFDAVNNAN